jgi:hypothetical protein
MKKPLFLTIKSYFLAPDWMLRKEIAALMFSMPIFLFFFAALFIYKNIDQQKKIETEILFIEKIFSSLEGKSLVPLDENYIKKHTEAIALLSSDKALLCSLYEKLDDKEQNRAILQRVKFYEGEENKLIFRSFSEENNLVWDLNKGVEVSRLDLIELINLVEGEQTDKSLQKGKRPNMFISKLTWNRKNRQSDVYNLDMQIIQKR